MRDDGTRSAPSPTRAGWRRRWTAPRSRTATSWLGATVADFVSEPHNAIVAERREERVLNLVAGEGEAHRAAIAHVVRDERPDAMVRALSLAAEIMHGVPATFRDPAAFSFAHGGKDGHPYPVDRRTYDATIQYLETAVRRARVGDRERLDALRRLDTLQRSA